MTIKELQELLSQIEADKKVRVCIVCNQHETVAGNCTHAEVDGNGNLVLVAGLRW